MTTIEPERLGRPRRGAEEQTLARYQRLDALGPKICANATKWLDSAGRKPPQLTSADVARYVDEAWQDTLFRATGLDGRGSLAAKVAEIEADAENDDHLTARTVLLLGLTLGRQVKDKFGSADFAVKSFDVDTFQIASAVSTEAEVFGRLKVEEILSACAVELSPVALQLLTLELSHGITTKDQQMEATGLPLRAIRKARAELEAFRPMLRERHAAIIAFLGASPVLRRAVSPQTAEAAGGGLLALLGGGAAAKLVAGGLAAVLATGAAVEIPRVVEQQRKPTPKIQSVTQPAAAQRSAPPVQATVESAVRRARFTVAQAQERQRQAAKRRAAAKRKAAAESKRKAAAKRRAQASTVTPFAPDTATAAPSVQTAPSEPSSPSSADIRPMDSGPSPVGQEFR